MHRRAFTLIELLVVFGVIALMLAILLPVLASAREEGRRAQCLSNLRQNAVFTAIYADENRGRLPELFYDWSPGGSGIMLVHVSPPWAAAPGWKAFEADLMLCPSDVEPATVKVPAAGGGTDKLPVSYAFNMDLLLRGERWDHVRQPSARILFFEGSMGKVQGRFRGVEKFVGKAWEPRHRGTGNAAYVDGHALSITSVPDKAISGGQPPLESISRTAPAVRLTKIRPAAVTHPAAVTRPREAPSRSRPGAGARRGIGMWSTRRLTPAAAGAPSPPPPSSSSARRCPSSPPRG